MKADRGGVEGRGGTNGICRNELILNISCKVPEGSPKSRALDFQQRVGRVLPGVNKPLENLVKDVTFKKTASGIEQSNPHTSLFPFLKVTLFSHVQDEEGVVHTPPRTPHHHRPSFPQPQLWPLTIFCKAVSIQDVFSSAWTTHKSTN